MTRRLVRTLSRLKERFKPFGQFGKELLAHNLTSDVDICNTQHAGRAHTAPEEEYPSEALTSLLGEGLIPLYTNALKLQ